MTFISRCGEDDPEVVIPGVRTPHHYVSVNIKGRTLSSSSAQSLSKSQDGQVGSVESDGTKNRADELATVAEEGMVVADDDDAGQGDMATVAAAGDGPPAAATEEGGFACPCGLEANLDGVQLTCRRCRQLYQGTCFLIFSEDQLPAGGHLCHVCTVAEGEDPKACTEPGLARRLAKDKPMAQTCMYRLVLAYCTAHRYLPRSFHQRAVLDFPSPGP